MNLVGQPNGSMIIQSPSPLTFFRSTNIEVTMLLYAFLLELVCGKHRVSGPSTCMEAALALREGTLLQVAEQTVEKETGENLASSQS